MVSNLHELTERGAKGVDQAQVVEELKSILQAPTEEEAYRKFEDFPKKRNP